MKKILLSVLVVLFAAAQAIAQPQGNAPRPGGAPQQGAARQGGAPRQGFTPRVQKNISIFVDHINVIASQEKISFAEAAGKVKELGYTGVDVRVTMSDEKQLTLDSLGFRHAAAIANIDFVKGDNLEEVNRTLGYMRKHKFTRVLLVPGLLPENAGPEVAEAAYSRIAAFARQAQAEGIDVMIEDFDNPRSICYNTPALDRIFEAAPEASHVFDTGNFVFAGEDVMTALGHFRKLVHHVHLKDKNADGASPAVGTGIVPMKEVIISLLKTGYDGWLTVEHFGSKKMLEDAAASFAYVSAAWDEFIQKYPKSESMRPGMTEPWTPQPLVVTPGAPIAQPAPSDAIILFDGTNLDEWVAVRGGGPAEWDLKDGVMTVNKKKGDIRTRRSFNNFQLHIEWRIPENISGTSQARGNSGLFLADRYEIQILDSYQNETYANGHSGSIYKQKGPLVNAMRKPGEWNVYDIVFTAPVFNADGTYLYPARVTVFHNGVLIQNNSEIRGTTQYIGHPTVQKHGPAPLRLQSHADPSEPISYRNIWIREL